MTFDLSPGASQKKPELRLFGVRLRAFAAAAIWLFVFGATAFIAPRFREMFEEMEIEGALPGLSRMVVAVPFLWWIAIAVAPAGAVILKDRFVSDRWRKIIDRAALAVALIMVPVLIIALFLPLDVMLENIPVSPPPPPATPPPAPPGM